MRRSEFYSPPRRLRGQKGNDMTNKRFRKLLRAYMTAYYLKNPEILTGWIGRFYRAVSRSKATNYAAALAEIQDALPLN